MTVFEIEVISDIVCAWCYIGKRTLERAIALYQKTYPNGKHDVFNVTWQPYYLPYALVDQSVDKKELAKTKLAGMSTEKVAAITKRVNQAGRGVGIEFKYGGKIGRTRDAHRLIWLSQTMDDREVQERLVEKLFEAYHEKEMDVSDGLVLKELALEAGMGDEQLDEILGSDVGGSLVDDEAEKNRARTNGVPIFVIQGKYRVEGAQDIQEFMELFVKVKEEEQSMETFD